MPDFIGRVTVDEHGNQVIEPVDRATKNEEVASYQQAVGKLIAAAYIWKTNPTSENLVELSVAADQLPD